MSYYNYHGIAKRLIQHGHLTSYEFVNKWNAISPALVLFFDCHPPMPIREYRWPEYMEFISNLNL